MTMTFAEYKAKRRPPGRLAGILILVVLLAAADAGALLWSAQGSIRKIRPPTEPGDIRGDFEPGVMTIVMLNVGQGDATFLRTPNGKNVLFDAGTGGDRYPIYAGYSHYNAGEKVVVPFLRSHGVGWIDTVVLSHPDGDHSGGMMNVWEHLYGEGKGIGHFIDPGIAKTSPAYKDQLEFLLEKDVSYTAILDPSTQEPRTELPWDFVGDPAVKMEIIAPLAAHDPMEHPNDHSVTIRAAVGPFVFLMAGDAENHQMEDMVRRYGPNLRTDFFWAAHHGSKTSILPAFLRLANPRVICNSSFPPMYAHPNILSVKNWSRHIRPKPRLFRTDLQGHLWFRATPERVQMRSMSAERSEPEQWAPGILARTAPEGPAAIFRRYGKLEPLPPARWENMEHEVSWTAEEIATSGGVAPGGTPDGMPQFTEPPKKPPRSDTEPAEDREAGETK